MQLKAYRLVIRSAPLVYWLYLYWQTKIAHPTHLQYRRIACVASLEWKKKWIADRKRITGWEDKEEIRVAGPERETNQKPDRKKEWKLALKLKRCRLQCSSWYRRERRRRRDLILFRQRRKKEKKRKKLWIHLLTWFFLLILLFFEMTGGKEKKNSEELGNQLFGGINDLFIKITITQR